MRKTALIFLAFVLAFGSRAIAICQETAKPAAAVQAPEELEHFFRIEIVIEELGADAKPINTRTYSGIVSTSHYGFSVRTGSRIPITTAVASATTEIEKKLDVQYIDVGVNMDARDAHEVDGKLALSLNTEITSLAESPSPIGSADPVIRQNRWQARALIPIGKPTVVFTSEALDSKGSTQLLVTVTPLH